MAGKAFYEVLQDALVAVVVNIGLKKVAEFSADKAVKLSEQKIEHEKYVACERAKVFVDLRTMTKADPKTTDKLWARYAVAKAELRENDFIGLLTLIPEEPPNGRQETLKFLNDCDDEQFDLAMNMLDHDWFIEWVQRVYKNGGRITQKELRRLKDAFQEAFAVTQGIGRAVVKQNDDLAWGFAMLVGGLADWLEKK